MRDRDTTNHGTFHDRAYRRARRGEQGRPGVLAWLAGLGMHVAVAALLVL